MRPLKDVPMTDLDKVHRLIELGRKASRARIGREITTEEMPEVLAGIFAAERIIAGLFEVSIGKEQTNAKDDPGGADGAMGNGG